MNFLHNFLPQPILFEWGFITVRYYGLIIAIALVVCFAMALYLASSAVASAKEDKHKEINTDDLYDLAFWLVLGGIVGARLYDVFLIDWNYFAFHLSDIIQIWHGGLAIHGAIIGGIIALIIWCKIKKKEIWRFAGLIFTLLPLGQAIGRWGNYFNSELFGFPTKFLWGIPIPAINRPEQYLNYQYFHPAFLYESILNLVLFFILLFLHKKNRSSSEIVLSYLIGYSAIRFVMEFIRIDATSMVLGIRLPQLVSLLVFVVCVFVFCISANVKKYCADFMRERLGNCRKR